MKLIKYLTPFVIARVFATIACLIFFVLQSQKEMTKYFSKITSASIQAKTNIDVRLPKIVICSQDSFKSDKFPKTVEEYINITYSKKEVIGTGGVEMKSLGMKLMDGVNVTEMATFMYGMCFVLEIPEDYNNKLQHNKDTQLHVNIPLNTTKEMYAYFVDHGQEACLENTVPNCDVPQGITVRDYNTRVIIRATKSILEGRYVHKYIYKIFHSI